ncbi:MAG: hypothetical protein HY815_01205 [Candidatus Riflebacteria bacterium]|nr:hypothetical protein [Candidatus Riflebacteria bacterium]
MILAVDPGREKCGLAMLEPDGRVLWHRIVTRSDLEAEVATLGTDPAVEAIVVGSGTSSGPLVTLLSKACGGDRVRVVDETNSTLDARALYFEDNPPRGLWSLLPRSLLCPPVPIDDYAAIVLGQRFLKERTR